jgi:hypothetical protein
VRGGIDHVSRRGFSRMLGTWPARNDPSPSSGPANVGEATRR